ncbi:MAG TPA: hemolysin family protein [Syntrophorhabdaceae bacterium]|nr:hemolysin family protein [Syntrophorhabdaceae bacterium]
MDSLTLSIVCIFILMVLNGVFSAGETAIVSFRKSKLKELLKERKDKKAETLLRMKENPERFLSAVQIGITLFGTLASAIGGILAVQYLSPLLSKVSVLKPFSDTFSLIIVVVIMTYLFLVFGELVPKYIGISNREKVSFFIAPLFDFISRALFILVDFLSMSTMLIVKALKLKKGEEHVGEGEIKVLIEEGTRKGIFDRTEEELIHGVFRFADRSVKDVMVPKPNVYAININDSKDRILGYIIENEFSRYPVYRDNFDNIIGIVHHKDIARYIWLETEPFQLERILKKPLFVPETMEISVLLRQMQRTHRHLAVVVDEYGTAVGIVTLEDIMEEIFGEIMDETDTEDKIEKLRDGSLIVDASYSVRDLNSRQQLDIPESTEYETLGGFILTKLQGMARGGEIIYYGAYKFTVVGIDGRRITKIKVERK